MRILRAISRSRTKPFRWNGWCLRPTAPSVCASSSSTLGSKVASLPQYGWTAWRPSLVLRKVVLRNAGFDSVDLELDIDKAGFGRAIRDFTQDAASADTAVIYYTGHGLEIS